MRSRAHSLLLLLAIAVLAAQPVVARPRPVKPGNYFPGAEFWANKRAA